MKTVQLDVKDTNIIDVTIDVTKRLIYSNIDVYRNRDGCTVALSTTQGFHSFFIADDDELIVNGTEYTGNDLYSYLKNNVFFTSTTSGGATTVAKTYAEAVALKNSGGLQKGALYHITNRGLYFQAIANNKFAKDGTREMLCPARYSKNEIDAHGNYWKGVWSATADLDNGLEINDLMIWGGKVWKNLTGEIGSTVDDFTLGEDWVLIPKESFTNYEYTLLTFGCQFDWANDWVERQWDAKGNVLGLDYESYQWWDGTVGGNHCDTSDWNFAANIDGDIMFDNVTTLIRNNRCGSIYSNSCPWGIQNNSNSGYISSNSNLGYIYKNSNAGEIAYNSNSGSIAHNSNNGSIAHNYNTSVIYSNSNAGEIANNSNNGYVYSNSNSGHITNNSNNGRISSNNNTGFILKNSNNGEIANIGSANTHIYNNTNNGFIQTTTTGEITETQVNK